MMRTVQQWILDAPPTHEMDFADIEARVYVWIRSLGKPRARWNDCGVGYWTVRTAENGAIYQGVGLTLSEAYGEWVSLHEPSTC